ncbi:MAG TPA: CDP-alcohol phosphatidyltransferase family protein [Microthrixaceae bacterium]|nr:CDP-alcohol phosphatidyltransferase family protein [Microthrixaceae bacterium]
MSTHPPDSTERTRTFGPSALLTPANVITVVRLLLAPVAFVLIYEQQSGWLLFGLWIAITASDSLDGYLARRQGTTRSGAFLDPLADKVLALGGLWAMVLAGRFWWLPVVLITVREALISAFRSYWGRKGLAVPASNVAKFKTFLQFSSVSLVVWPWTTGYTWMADTVLWLAVAVAWISAAQYVQAGSRATTTMTGD